MEIPASIREFFSDDEPKNLIRKKEELQIMTSDEMGYLSAGAPARIENCSAMVFY